LIDLKEGEPVANPIHDPKNTQVVDRVKELLRLLPGEQLALVDSFVQEILQDRSMPKDADKSDEILKDELIKIQTTIRRSGQ
jgi:hypothetical protein